MASSSQRTNKPGSVEGYCDNIHKGKSVLVSTLETVLDMETLMVIQAGIQCPAWSLKKFHSPNNHGNQNNAVTHSNSWYVGEWSCMTQDVIANKPVKGFF